MGMWIREIAGWLMVIVGLVLIGFVLQLALDRSVLEAVAVMIPGTVVFRAGVSLVKLTTAARAAAQAVRPPQSPSAPGR